MKRIPFNDLVITKIEIFKLNIPYIEPFIISLGVINEAKNIALRIHTNQEGLYGVGEASPFPLITGDIQASDFELAKVLSKVLIGKNPLEIEDRIFDLNKDVKFNPTIKSAFDMALYDIIGKYNELPLYAIWGGKNDRLITTDMTVSINTPEKMAKDALAFKNAGFPAIKAKIGGSTKEDLARIKAIRAAIGKEMALRVDANQGWDTITAINTLKAIALYGVEHCEEPIPRWNYTDLPYVRANSPIAIMADESIFDDHDAYRLASMKACDYFNIKLSKSGGLHNALKIISIAEASGIKSQVGCMSESRLALTALTHLVMARKNIVHFDIDSALMLDKDPVVGGLIYKDNGRIELSAAPGIGADFDQAYLKEMEKVVVNSVE